MRNIVLVCLSVSAILGACDDGNAQGTTVVCGNGTHLDGATCVRDQDPTTITCGEGTALDPTGRACLAADPLTCGDGTAREGSACVADGSILSCGTGTERVDDACVGTLRCGSGTTQSGTMCVASATQLRCGSGTEQVGSTCVATLTCGEGTVKDVDECVGDPDGSLCASGTSWSGSQCVVTPAGGNPDLASFSALSSYTTSHYAVWIDDSARMSHRFVVTTANQTQADGWTEAFSPLIGNLGAVHIRLGDYFPKPIDEPTSFAIFDATTMYGNCEYGVYPGLSDQYDEEARVNFFVWNNLGAAATACAEGGVLTLQRDPLDASRVKVVLNVQFNDGTVWSDKTFTAPYRLQE